MRLIKLATNMSVGLGALNEIGEVFRQSNAPNKLFLITGPTNEGCLVTYSCWTWYNSRPYGGQFSLNDIFT